MPGSASNGLTIVTERLELRPLVADDLEALCLLHAAASFWHFPFRRGWTRNETETFLDRVLAEYQAGEHDVCAVVVKATGELAGWAGLSVPTFLPELLPAVEVGWRLGERYRGVGYAGEAGAAWVRHGFEVIGLERIVSVYEPENVESGAVMSRLGFTFDREAVHPRFGMLLHVLSLSRSVWQTRLHEAE